MRQSRLFLVAPADFDHSDEIIVSLTRGIGRAIVANGR